MSTDTAQAAILDIIRGGTNEWGRIIHAAQLRGIDHATANDALTALRTACAIDANTHNVRAGRKSRTVLTYTIAPTA